MLNRSLMVGLIALALASAGHAQTILFRTNEVGVGYADHTLYGESGSFRLNITVTDDGDLKNMADIPTFRLTVKDVRDQRIMQQVTDDPTGDGNDPASGQVRFVISTNAAGTYELKAVAIPASGTNDQYIIHWGYLTVTNPPDAAAGGGGDVNLVITSDVTVVETGSGNVITQLQASGSTIVAARGLLTGGSGGGISAINGDTNTSQVITGAYPIAVTTVGGITTIAWEEGGVIIAPPTATNKQIITYSAPVTNSFVVPVGVSNLYVYLWGAGGGYGARDVGGAGGYATALISVSPSEVLKIIVGQGGQYSYYTAPGWASGGYPNGGDGYCTATANNGAGGGGGMSAILRGTNYLVIAGGGGGAGDEGEGGAGGGLEGTIGGESTSASGTAGTQSAGGSNGGGYLAGGDSSTTADTRGGGGGGWYGGGSGRAANGGGAGGSGYLSASLIFGAMFAGSGKVPLNTAYPDYVAGSAYGGDSSVNAGGDGLVVIQW